jgi:hypothetical protein
MGDVYDKIIIGDEHATILWKEPAFKELGRKFPDEKKRLKEAYVNTVFASYQNGSGSFTRIKRCRRWLAKLMGKSMRNLPGADKTTYEVLNHWPIMATDQSARGSVIRRLRHDPKSFALRLSSRNI